MTAQVWAIVGVVVGAVLGGGAQIIADSLRGARERRRWIDDHRRVAYLTFLEAIENLSSAMQADSQADLGQAHQMPRTGPANSAFFNALHTVRFYGSETVLQHVEAVVDVAMIKAFFALQSEEFADFVGTLREIRPAIENLSSAMRSELGINS